MIFKKLFLLCLSFFSVSAFAENKYNIILTNADFGNVIKSILSAGAMVVALYVVLRGITMIMQTFYENYIGLNDPHRIERQMKAKELLDRQLANSEKEHAEFERLYGSCDAIDDEPSPEFIIDEKGNCSVRY